MKRNNVPGPVLYARAFSLPMAWEQSIVQMLKGDYARNIPTEYDQEGDVPSLDTPAIIEVIGPLDEPRVHRALPGGLLDLKLYTNEVVHGIDDPRHVPQEERPYTYHERLFAYPVPDEVGQQSSVEQMSNLISTLIETGYTRRAQAITWVPESDQYSEHPPCLQRIQFRIIDDQLEMHSHFRSNDAIGAAFMNMYALTELQRWIANEISRQRASAVDVGRYIHFADSYHIYSKDFNRAHQVSNDTLKRHFHDRTYTTEYMEEMIADDMPY